uniref:G-protein coupled receptors family 1 profile domain-containing protein n=1 Tax=Acrobeloides nanus TaxID=290746 RepID=A0A914CPE5_9BILA
MDNSTNRNCTTHFDYVENPPIEEARVVGIIYLFLCSFCIIPYLIVMSTIVSNKSLSKIHAYRIMVHLGVMDVGELFSFYLVITLMMITNSTFDYLFDKVSFYKTKRLCENMVKSNAVFCKCFLDISRLFCKRSTENLLN